MHDTSKNYPIWAILKKDGRKMTWLAEQIGYSYTHVCAVKSGTWPVTRRFRERCVEVLGKSESELFTTNDRKEASHD